MEYTEIREQTESELTLVCRFRLFRYFRVFRQLSFDGHCLHFKMPAEQERP